MKISFLCLHLYILLSVSSVQSNEGLYGYLRRSLIGSNCIIIERGNIPPYEKCLGCEIPEAMNCIDDMRNNVTGNVPPGCNIRAISEEYDSSCCPRYGSKSKDRFFETTAYPKGLACLRSVGCGGTEMYENLLQECKSVCKFDVSFNDLQFTCTGIRNPAFAARTNMILGSLCTSVLLYLILM